MGDWLARNRVAVFATLLNFVLMGAVVLALRWPPPGAVEIVAPIASPAVQASVALQVYVSGAVARPDVYELPGGSITKHALAAAGGPTEDADLDRINLAAPLVDASHVYIPRKGDPGEAGGSGATGALAPVRLNVNTAELTQLDTLPGIGPATARAIIDYRIKHGPFPTIEALLDVPGIGDVTLSNIRDLVTVR